MPPDRRDVNPPSAKHWRRLAVVLWIVLILVVCIRGAWQQHTHSLYLTFKTAGSHWLAGTSLYHWAELEQGLEPYRYSPLVAVMLAPFDRLPDSVGSVLWRLLNAGVLLGGLAAWLRSPLPWQLDARQRALIYLLVLPLAAISLNNGQTNPLVIGFLLLTIALASAGHWTRAAICTALATALKVYPVTLGLLLAAAYPRRFAGRLLVALAVVAVLPFLFQRQAYVTGQYGEWMRALLEDDRKMWPLHMAYRDLWLVFRVIGVPLSPQAYQVVQVVSGGLCAAVCVAGRWRGWEPARVLMAVLTLGTCWMTLCGPATESSTYVLLAPALAWSLLARRVEHWPQPVRWLPDVAGGLLLIGLLAGLTRSTAVVHSLGVQPLAALLLFAAYLAVHTRALGPGAATADADVGGAVARAA
jgi:hypothetical protein